MRHLLYGKKLNRDANHRKDMLKTMMSQLILNGKLTTTETKAKVLLPATEHLLHKAKEGTVHVRRQLMVELGSEESVKRAIETMAGEEIKTRTGGFIKSIRLGRRLGDNTMMVRLELPVIEKKIEEKKEEKKATTKTKATKTTKK